MKVKIIDRDDNFVIRINKKNKDDIELINSMLEENKFNIKYTKYDEKGNYYINANKYY